ncbi:putative C-type lectin, partial [Trypoxylus dichotomus]
MYTRCDNQSVLERLNETENKLLFLHEVRQCPDSDLPVSNRPGRFLSLPVPQKCANRPKQFSFRGHNYFFSGHVPALAGKKMDWLDGRNLCREYCMDLVSMETQEENNMIFKLIQQ